MPIKAVRALAGQGQALLSQLCFPSPELDSQEAYLEHSRWDTADGSQIILEKWLFPTSRKIKKQ